MASIGWLHLADLHQGPDPDGLPRTGFTSDVRSDLERMHERSGPWEVVLFAGDLAREGTTEDYARVGEVLAKLWEVLRALGSTPVLLAVPGNHDRSALPSGKLKKASEELAEAWHREEAVRSRFWDDAKAPGRQAVARAFAPFTAWWNAGVRGQPGVELREGALPGDFSATVTSKDGLRLGVVGLNSSFLQLGSDSAWGRIALDPRQLRAVCDDVEAWQADRDVALLMTHHGPAWLHPDSQKLYQREINPPGRFALHLAGHVQDRSAWEPLSGDGGLANVLYAPTLEALWPFGPRRSATRGGYNAGRVELSGPRASLRVWPRITEPDDPPFFHFVANPSIVLGPEEALVLPLPASEGRVRRESQALAAAPRRELRAPDDTYDPAWFVDREAETKTALGVFERPGRPLLLWGPGGFGKTAFLAHMAERMKHGAPRARVVRVDLSRFDKESWESSNSFVREFSEQLVREVEGTREGLEAARRQRRSQIDTITWLIERYVLPTTEGQLVLAIDSAHRLLRQDYAGDTLDALPRGLEYDGYGPLSRFHIVLVLPQPPDTLARPLRSRLDSITAVELGALAVEDLRALARLHGLTPTGEEISQLMTLVGGHPTLSRKAMFHAASEGRRLGELLDGARDGGGVFADHLERTRWWLQQDRRLPGALRDVMVEGQAPRSAELFGRLFELGIVVREPSGRCRLRGSLYEQLGG